MIYYISEQMEFDNIIKESLNDINNICIDEKYNLLLESFSIKDIAIKIKDFFIKIFNKFIEFLKKFFYSAKITMIRKRIKNVIDKYSKEFNINIHINESNNDSKEYQLSLFNNPVYIDYRMVSKDFLDEYLFKMTSRYTLSFKPGHNEPEDIQMEHNLVGPEDTEYRGLVKKIVQLATIDKCLITQLQTYPNELMKKKRDLEKIIVDNIIINGNTYLINDYNNPNSIPSLILQHDVQYLISLFETSAVQLCQAANILMSSITSIDIQNRMNKYRNRAKNKVSIEDRKRELGY